MLGFNHVSIKSKLQLMLLFVGLGSILIVGYQGWSKIRSTQTTTVFNQLTSLRSSRAYQIESYFSSLRGHAETLCEDRMVVAAMVEFNKAFRGLNQEYIEPEWEQAIEEFYNQEYFAKLSQRVTGELNYETYRPVSQAGRYVQYHYIVKNSYPVGEKDKLDDPGDGSEYSKFHTKYHDLFRNLAQQFGYSDILLINFKTGDVVYSVKKEPDLGINLERGAYRESHIAEVLAAVKKNPERRAIQIVDFKPYRPSYMAPVAFVAGPIYNGPHLVGVLAIQIPADKINDIMTGNRQWKQTGLGNTGETYLVGSDLLMRSVSRSLIENPKQYESTLRVSGTPDSRLPLIRQLGTSILLQKVDTQAAREALSGITATKIVKDYRGQAVLSSFSPLRIQGLDWGIVAQMHLWEAYQPVQALQRDLLIATVILVLVMVYLANIIAHAFVRPIRVMLAGSQKGGIEESEFETLLTSRDEFGELANIVNKMAHGVHKQTELVEQKNRENEALLASMFPKPVIERLKQGETHIADQIQEVTVLVGTIAGLTKWTLNRPVEEVAHQLNQLMATLDESAEQYDVEKFRMLGDRYIAVCGLTKPRLDHSKRMMDFALEAIDRLQSFSTQHGTKLILGAGVHTGTVMAGIIGSKKFTYELWGETLAIATQLNLQTEPNTIRVTQAVHERLQDLYSFEKDKDINFEDQGKIATWVLRKGGLRDLIDDLAIALDDDWGSPDETETAKAKLEGH